MREEAMHKEVRKAKRTILIAFGCVMALAVLAVAAFCVYRYQHTFSQEKWHTDRENRYKIVDDLLETVDLIGMTESEIVSLLGEEDSEQSSFKGNRQQFPPETTLVYYLGVDYMDCNWLIISLEQGVAVAYDTGIT